MSRVFRSQSLMSQVIIFVIYVACLIWRAKYIMALMSHVIYVAPTLSVTYVARNNYVTPLVSIISFLNLVSDLL